MVWPFLLRIGMKVARDCSGRRILWYRWSEMETWLQGRHMKRRTMRAQPYCFVEWQTTSFFANHDTWRSCHSRGGSQQCSRKASAPSSESFAKQQRWELDELEFYVFYSWGQCCCEIYTLIIEPLRLWSKKSGSHRSTLQEQCFHCWGDHWKLCSYCEGIIHESDSMLCSTRTQLCSYLALLILWCYLGRKPETLSSLNEVSTIQSDRKW